MNYDTELNFSLEFNLSQNGMIKEIETELDILRICFTQLKELDAKQHPSIERIMVMPLRKLLCEKNSVLLRVCQDFKMPPVQGELIHLTDKLIMTRPPLRFPNISSWIPLSTWHETNIAFFDKTVNDLPKHILPNTFQPILNKLKKEEKASLENLFEFKEILIDGRRDYSYVRKFTDNDIKNQLIYDLLKKANYYDLNVYNFIKHLSDKRGAHIDIGHSPIISMVNKEDNNGFTLTMCFAVHLIWAVKNQITELTNYWPEFDAIIGEVIE